MRVLHLGKYYAPQRGGIERHLEDLARWLVANGAEVDALVHQPGRILRSRSERRDGVHVVRAGSLGTALYAPISPAYAWRMSHLLRERRPDLLHLHLPNPSAFWALVDPVARALPWIVHWHADVSPDMPDWRVRLAYRAYRPFEQAVLARASAIIATSQPYLDASDALSRWHSKARVIPLGIGDEPGHDPRQAPTRPPRGGLRLLAVGRMSHYKGFDILLDALARVPDASLVLVGTGEEDAKLRERARGLGLAGRVDFRGDVDDDALHALYRCADVFVLPSLDRSEAFGIVLLEAMRAGVAVVASDIPGSGVRHVVADGASGVRVPRGNAEALADVLRQLGADPQRRALLGAGGRDRWQACFTLERSARQVLALYRELLGTHRPEAAPAA
ncbi:glycosyltransferase [Dokdonella sp. MW10]|uniref:glycosyltransferase n=1 Tax=Dokdonella sp. MW10 TaxID=2992926 RepID=UPI003F7D197A